MPHKPSTPTAQLTQKDMNWSVALQESIQSSTDASQPINLLNKRSNTVTGYRNEQLSVDKITNMLVGKGLTAEEVQQVLQVRQDQQFTHQYEPPKTPPHVHRMMQALLQRNKEWEQKKQQITNQEREKAMGVYHVDEDLDPSFLEMPEEMLRHYLPQPTRVPRQMKKVRSNLNKSSQQQASSQQSDAIDAMNGDQSKTHFGTHDVILEQFLREHTSVQHSRVTNPNAPFPYKRKGFFGEKSPMQPMSLPVTADPFDLQITPHHYSARQDVQPTTFNYYLQPSPDTLPVYSPATPEDTTVILPPIHKKSKISAAAAAVAASASVVQSSQKTSRTKRPESSIEVSAFVNETDAQDFDDIYLMRSSKKIE
ncbi:hypothetical protein AKO1_004535 [Acrasis kona]|uniref:Uncharacterized protein n=1 Tax=Acrasis kona TaxID=1008807 RepID=A0AAW2Z282_9EUKA